MSEAAALPRRNPGQHWPPDTSALDDTIEQIFAGIPEPVAPTAPTMADADGRLWYRWRWDEQIGTPHQD